MVTLCRHKKQGILIYFFQLIYYCTKRNYGIGFVSEREFRMAAEIVPATYPEAEKVKNKSI